MTTHLKTTQARIEGTVHESSASKTCGMIGVAEVEMVENGSSRNAIEENLWKQQGTGRKTITKENGKGKQPMEGSGMNHSGKRG